MIPADWGGSGELHGRHQDRACACSGDGGLRCRHILSLGRRKLLSACLLSRSGQGWEAKGGANCSSFLSALPPPHICRGCLESSTQSLAGGSNSLLACEGCKLLPAPESSGHRGRAVTPRWVPSATPRGLFPYVQGNRLCLMSEELPQGWLCANRCCVLLIIKLYVFQGFSLPPTLGLPEFND